MEFVKVLIMLENFFPSFSSQKKAPCRYYCQHEMLFSYELFSETVKSSQKLSASCVFLNTNFNLIKKSGLLVKV